MVNILRIKLPLVCTAPQGVESYGVSKIKNFSVQVFFQVEGGGVILGKILLCN